MRRVWLWETRAHRGTVGLSWPGLLQSLHASTSHKTTDISDHDLKHHCCPTGERLVCFQRKKNWQEPGALSAWVTQDWKLSLLLLLWQLSTGSGSGGQTPVPQAWQAGGGHCNSRERDLWETQWRAHLTEPHGAGCSVPPFQGMAKQLPPGPMDHRGPAWG